MFIKKTSVKFIEWDSLKSHTEEANSIKTLLKKMAVQVDGLNPFPNEWFDFVKEILTLFEENNPKPRWKADITSINDVESIMYKDVPCCFVKDGCISEYNDLVRLEKLTYSLRRPAEAICCIVGDDERRDNINRYAKLYLSSTFLFADNSGDCEKYLYEKYGKPYEQRSMINACKKSKKMLDDMYLRQLNVYIKERNEIESRNIGTGKSIAIKDISKLAFLKGMLSALEANKGNYDEISKLLNQDTAQRIGGVSE